MLLGLIYKVIKRQRAWQRGREGGINGLNSTDGEEAGKRDRERKLLGTGQRGRQWGWRIKGQLVICLPCYLIKD